jgi:ABC-2 type transport system ATP-binding protein
MSAAESAERGESLLRLFGLGTNSNQLISTYSRGMRQRLGIARALVNDPRVLFLDEPTLGLDPAGREDVLSHLTSAVATNGAGVVLCSHLLDDVERVCDRVAILDRGRVVALGTVSDVIETAGIGGRMRIVVAPDGAGQALGQLLKMPQVARAESSLSRPGEIDIDLVEREPHANQILSLLVGAGIEVRGVELQGARLSEAFLTLTKKDLER